MSPDLQMQKLLLTLILQSAFSMIFRPPLQKNAEKNRKNQKIENLIIFDRVNFVFMVAHQFLEQTVQNPRTT